MNIDEFLDSPEPPLVMETLLRYIEALENRVSSLESGIHQLRQLLSGPNPYRQPQSLDQWHPAPSDFGKYTVNADVRADTMREMMDKIFEDARKMPVAPSADSAASAAAIRQAIKSLSNRKSA